jgi:hypothetical protein
MSHIRQSGYYPTNETGALVAVPATMRFNALPSPLGGNVTDRFVQSTSSTTVTSSQLIRFELPPVDYLMPGSVFLRAKVACKATAKADTSFILSSAADFIRRLDVRCGGTTLDSINRYNRLYQVLKHVNCPTQYVATDGNALELMDFTYPAAAADGVFDVDVEFCIPIVSGVTTTDRAIPLQLLRSPLVFSIELDAPSALNAAAGFDFRIQDPRLYYQTCDMGEVYNQSLAMELQQTGLMRLPYTTFSESEYSIGAAGTFSPLIGENCSSLLGVLVARKRDKDVLGKGIVTDIFAQNGFVDVQFKVDGMNKPMYLIDSPTLAYAEVQKLFSMLWDTDHSGSQTRAQAIVNNGSAAITAHGNGTKFVYGFSATRFHENGLSSVGTPVTNNIQIFQNGNTDACQAFVFTIKEYSLLISPETIQVAK